MEKNEFIKMVGVNIKSLREEKHLTVDVLAHDAGIESIQLNNIENGKTNASIYITYNIASALGMSLSDLFIYVQ